LVFIQRDLFFGLAAYLVGLFAFFSKIFQALANAGESGQVACQGFFKDFRFRVGKEQQIAMGRKLDPIGINFGFYRTFKALGAVNLLFELFNILLFLGNGIFNRLIKSAYRVSSFGVSVCFYSAALDVPQKRTKNKINTNAKAIMLDRERHFIFKVFTLVIIAIFSS
jgi:hypothetical protein